MSFNREIYLITSERSSKEVKKESRHDPTSPRRNDFGSEKRVPEGGTEAGQGGINIPRLRIVFEDGKRREAVESKWRRRNTRCPDSFRVAAFSQCEPCSARVFVRLPLGYCYFRLTTLAGASQLV
ncbi:uncharacterized protein LOC143264883 [Megachile rotundata]|uniref:uncharacterized protein LOC143264883 n=1 Tax=Megachile rotundata TaxID=143995 RepID=UPI003FD5DCF9